MDSALPPIPAKRYFTIGEVSELCLVKPYVLRYWEQEFVQLKPMKRRGNRRYYQHHEVLLIRRIRELLYDEGFTISGARNRLSELGANGQLPKAARGLDDVVEPQVQSADDVAHQHAVIEGEAFSALQGDALAGLVATHPDAARQLREALVAIRVLLD